MKSVYVSVAADDRCEMNDSTVQFNCLFVLTVCSLKNADCIGLGSILGCGKMKNRLQFLWVNMQVRRLVSPCLALECTARAKIVGHIKQPTCILH